MLAMFQEEDVHSVWGGEEDKIKGTEKTSVNVSEIETWFGDEAAEKLFHVWPFLKSRYNFLLVSACESHAQRKGKIFLDFYDEKRKHERPPPQVR